MYDVMWMLQKSINSETVKSRFHRICFQYVICLCSTIAEQLQCSCSTINHVARTLSQKLYELKDRIQNAVVSRVVEDFIDISSPLKHFTDAVHVPQGQLNVILLWGYKERGRELCAIYYVFPVLVSMINLAHS